MPEDLKDIDARLHALQQFLKQVRSRPCCLRTCTTPPRARYGAVAGQTEVAHGSIVNRLYVWALASHAAQAHGSRCDEGDAQRQRGR